MGLSFLLEGVACRNYLWYVESISFFLLFLQSMEQEGEEDDGGGNENFSIVL